QWINQIMSEFISTPADQLIGLSSSELCSQYLDSFADHPDLWKVSNVTSRQNRWLISLDTPPGAEPVKNNHIRYYVDVSEIMKLKTEVRNLQDQLDNNSTADSLTGLLNKRSLLQSLEPQVSRSRRYNNPLTLIVMEINNFEAHSNAPKPAIDQALTAVSFYLRDQMRWVDLVGRTGDNEFTLILPETRLDDANTLVEKINARLAKLSLPDTPEVTISVDAKFGVAEWEKGDDTSLLLKKAKNNLTNIGEETVA
ncbi:MAG: GGDEF domain-containing protein, partial [Gammaproteobacteria bacterium]|nr:GGDEF domain-containing protein [Gammaproteobacteria bacterium]